MKFKQLFAALALSVTVATVNAQTAIPEGYTKATVTLANGTSQAGFIKDNIKKSASVIFMDEAGKNKTEYDANTINAVKTTEANFVSINGDFFKSLSAGKVNFLQKASNSAGKAIYNGSEAIFSNGTEGKIGDYFAYTDNRLKLLNKKTVESFITTDLTGCTEAIEKAKAINGDIAKLQQAVEIYNNYSLK